MISAVWSHLPLLSSHHTLHNNCNIEVFVRYQAKTASIGRSISMCPAHAVLDQRQSSELSVHPSISNHHMKPVETPAEQTATTSSGIQNSFDSSTRETSAILPTTNTTVLRNGKVDSLRVSNCASSNTSPLQPSEIQNGDFQYSSLHNKNTCHDQNSNPLSKRDSSYNNANTIAGDHNSAGGTHHDDSQISSGKDTACSYNTTHSDSSSTDTGTLFSLYMCACMYISVVKQLFIFFYFFMTGNNTRIAQFVRHLDFSSFFKSLFYPDDLSIRLIFCFVSSLVHSLSFFFFF